MKPTTPMKAIRLKCLDCCAGQLLEINKCDYKNCPLENIAQGTALSAKFRPIIFRMRKLSTKIF